MNEVFKGLRFGLNYHPGKANMVANALSCKSLHVSWMMVKEAELVEGFRDLNLEVTLTPYSIRLNRIKVTSDFKGKIARSQMEDEEFFRQ